MICKNKETNHHNILNDEVKDSDEQPINYDNINNINKIILKKTSKKCRKMMKRVAKDVNELLLDAIDLETRSFRDAHSCITANSHDKAFDAIDIKIQHFRE